MFLKPLTKETMKDLKQGDVVYVLDIPKNRQKTYESPLGPRSALKNWAIHKQYIVDSVTNIRTIRVRTRDVRARSGSFGVFYWRFGVLDTPAWMSIMLPNAFKPQGRSEKPPVRDKVRLSNRGTWWTTGTSPTLQTNYNVRIVQHA